jgi:iron complex transport system ATP-binding protein
LLQVKNLACGYDSKAILKDINFRLREKEILGIIGPNGCGKTTLFRALTRIIKPIKGEVFLREKNIQNLSFKELAKKVAVVSQSQDLGYNITVRDYALLGRIPHRKMYQFLDSSSDEEIVSKSLDMTDTLGFKERLLNELSGGERQLVSLSRALTQEPELLLLDEPTSHLDITHQVRILDLLKRLNREEGITVIVILHDLNLASEYCDRLVLLNNGSIHKIGSPSEVLTYQIIEEVYRTVVVVKENPISSRPFVFIVSRQSAKTREG